MAREDITNLGIVFRESLFDFLPVGVIKLDEIYRAVSERWPQLCDDRFLCGENCNSGHKIQPEWKHEVRRCLDFLKRHSSGFIQKGENRGEWIIGSDLLPMFEPSSEKNSPERFKRESNVLKRDSIIVRKLKILYENQCQICGTAIELKKGEWFYSEGHHIKPLGSPHGGPDDLSNILIVCPNDHVRCDHFSMPLSLDKLRVHPQHQIDIQFIEYHNRCNKKFNK